MTHDDGYERAGGAPRQRLTRSITSIIEQRHRYVTIDRPTKTTGDLDQVEETLEDHTEQLWFHSTRRFVDQTDVGERIEADVFALGLDGIDVQHGDRCTYGGVEYTVDQVVGRPHDASADGTDHDDTQYFVIALTRYAP